MTDYENYMYTPSCPLCKFFGDESGVCEKCKHRKTYLEEKEETMKRTTRNMRVTKQYMENVLKKLIRDIEAKEYEWCSGGMQITIALDREEASFLLGAVERLEGEADE